MILSFVGKMSELTTLDLMNALKNEKLNPITQNEFIIELKHRKKQHISIFNDLNKERIIINDIKTNLGI